MAARAEGKNSPRFFHFEQFEILGRAVRPLFAWNIEQDFKKLRALL